MTLVALFLFAAITDWSQVKLGNSTSEAAKVLGIGVNAVRELIHQGVINAVRLGERKYIIPKRELMRLLGEENDPESGGLSEWPTPDSVVTHLTDHRQVIPDA